MGEACMEVVVMGGDQHHQAHFIIMRHKNFTVSLEKILKGLVEA